MPLQQSVCNTGTCNQAVLAGPCTYLLCPSSSLARWWCLCWSTQTISLMKFHVSSDSLNSDCVCQCELDKPVVQGYSQGIILEHLLYKAARLILWQVEQAVPWRAALIFEGSLDIITHCMTCSSTKS